MSLSLSPSPSLSLCAFGEHADTKPLRLDEVSLNLSPSLSAFGEHADTKPLQYGFDGGGEVGAKHLAV